jgi:hypothetical protein
VTSTTSPIYVKLFFYLILKKPLNYIDELVLKIAYLALLYLNLSLFVNENVNDLPDSSTAPANNFGILNESGVKPPIIFRLSD